MSTKRKAGGSGSRRGGEVRVRPTETARSTLPKNDRKVTVAIDAITAELGEQKSKRCCFPFLYTMDTSRNAQVILLVQRVLATLLGTEVKELLSKRSERAEWNAELKSAYALAAGDIETVERCIDALGDAWSTMVVDLRTAYVLVNVLPLQWPLTAEVRGFVENAYSQTQEWMSKQRARADKRRRTGGATSIAKGDDDEDDDDDGDEDDVDDNDSD